MLAKVNGFNVGETADWSHRPSESRAEVKGPLLTFRQLKRKA